LVGEGKPQSASDIAGNFREDIKKVFVYRDAISGEEEKEGTAFCT